MNELKTKPRRSPRRKDFTREPYVAHHTEERFPHFLFLFDVPPPPVLKADPRMSPNPGGSTNWFGSGSRNKVPPYSSNVAGLLRGGE
ncbi:unnamed protein product [Boreogadus saida]